MVFRMQLTYHEIIDTVYIKYIDAKTVSYTLPPRIYEIGNTNSMLKSLLRIESKVNITIDDKSLISNLTTNKTILSVETSFLPENRFR